jgi:hypothetical protein
MCHDAVFPRRIFQDDGDRHTNGANFILVAGFVETTVS